MKKKIKESFSIVSYLQTHYHFKLDFPKVDQHTGGRRLMRGTKRHKDNKSQSLEPPSTIF